MALTHCPQGLFPEFSRAFLTALPSLYAPCTDSEFREMFAHFVGAPSPACAPVQGQQLHCGRASGNGLIDAHGDNILNSTMPGGLPMKVRHDPIVSLFTGAIHEAGGVAFAECERLFLTAVPPAARGNLNRLIRPDVVYQLPGQPLRLGEVKTISANKGWYGERYHLPGTLRRARVVGPAYLSHARAIDRKLHLAVGDPANPHGPNLAPGPIELRLRLVAPVVALVVGAWGEVSDDLRRLVDNLAIVGADKMAAQLCLPRVQATAWVRQLLVSRVGFVSTRAIAQHRLLGMMAAAPAAAKRAAAARAGGDDARIFSLKDVLATRAAARHCGAWASALART